MRLIITDGNTLGLVLMQRSLGVCHGIVSIVCHGAEEEDRPPSLLNVQCPVLKLTFDDCEQDNGISLGPTWEDVEKIIDLAGMIPDVAYGYVVMHCLAGVSRSAAAMAILLAARSRTLAEVPLFANLLQHCDRARTDGLRADYGISPNRRMIWMGDELLDRAGRFGRACEEIYYPGEEPFETSTLPRSHLPPRVTSPP
jgi:predicted protein tyrosine phosphatase